uniref:Peptidase A2 domain-containing protein n=1 Tax=Haemonchus contortus TaxID=6289 RepID=A0A7I4XW16_HAECO
MRHGAPSPDSPVGNLDKCSYETGNCILRDGSILLWTPNKLESCRFTPVMRMKGRQLGEVWISDSKEFALSWRDSSEQLQDCGVSLIVTDQGYAIAPITRTARFVPLAAVGLVTSNQLSAQLLAVEGTVTSAVSSLFHHALSSLCDRTNLLAFALHTSLAADPTLTLRKLLGRSDIAASSLSDDLVQVHRCMAIPPRNFELIPFNGTCFTKPLVRINPPSGSAVISFVDPTTMVISQQASATECSAVGHFYFAHESTYLKFDPLTGEAHALPRGSIRDVGIPSSTNASALASPLTIFHNLILTNLSELVQDNQWQEMWSVVSSDHFAQAQPAAPRQRTTSNPTRSSLPAFTDVSEEPFSPGALELARVQIDASSSWPPRAIMAPINVLYLTDPDRFFVAQIPIRVNNIRVLALVDTGASITITSVDTAPLFGAFNLTKSDVTSAVGMAGVPVQLLGCAPLLFEIGSLSFRHPVFFTKSACIPDVADAYNIILGNDLLCRLPPWSIDYGNRTLRFADQHVKILFSTPSEAPPSSDQPVPVRVAETTVLPPSAESFVPCQVDGTGLEPLMLVSQSGKLSEKSLMVTPAVVNVGKPLLLVANPTPQSVTLYKGQHILSAVPLQSSGSSQSISSSPDSRLFVGNVSPRADGPESKERSGDCEIDLSQAEVSDDERRELAQLFYEFRDRISTDSYDLGSYEASEIVIKTTTQTPPINFRPPLIPVKFQKELDDHINKLLRAGRIVESDTPWVHNTVLVKKRDGSLRVCLDFRPLNSVTIPDHYPLPRIEDILAKIAGHKFYTTLDLASDADTFINDYRRLNVATTRCRHGQFVFGHAQSLRALPTWNTLLQWAYSLRAVVTQSQVLRYFEP